MTAKELVATRVKSCLQKHQSLFSLGGSPHNTLKVYYVQLSQQLFVINHLIDAANMFLLTTK